MLGSSTIVELEGGQQLRVLKLTELLAIKTRAGRPKDLAAIPYIQSTLDELARPKDAT